jgi:ABC-type polysaccharide/polyol phosphate transport system ATPase subunit
MAGLASRASEPPPGESAISVSGVSKVYRIWKTPAARLYAGALARAGTLPLVPAGLGRRLTRLAGNAFFDFHALKDVSFEVGRGESVGIIGKNGSGKSTLLQIVAGVLAASGGRVETSGRVAALLELGSSFHPEFTGRDNVYLSALILGLTTAEIDQRLREIIGFADIGQFIDQPVRTYSTGMLMRLAFSVSVAIEPDILVIDEVLAVGDSRFQQKCLEHIRRLRVAGSTLVVASHIPEQIRSLCDAVLVLEDGRVAVRDEPEPALRHYTELMNERTARRARALGRSPAPAAQAAEGTRRGTHEVTIEAVRIAAGDGRERSGMRAGEAVVIELDYQFWHELPDFALSFGLYSAAHVKCWETMLPSAVAVFGPLGQQGTIRCVLPALPLLSGRYYVNVGAYPPGCAWVYDYHWQMHPLTVVSATGGGGAVSGVLALEATWSLAPVPGVSGRRTGDD